MKNTVISGASLQTLRESLHLARDDVAAAVGVQSRTIKHWEHARMRVPNDVAEAMLRWRAEVDALAGAVIKQVRSLGSAAPSVVLVRYRTRDDLLACWPDWPLDMPWGLHAAALGRVVQALPGVELRWFDAERYGRWIAKEGVADSSAARAQWAVADVGEGL